MQLPEPEQTSRQKRAHYLHYERQGKYPKNLRRKSPRRLLPKIEPRRALSMKTCMENLARPNEFIYLFRLNGVPVTTYVWYKTDKERFDAHTYPTLPAAIIPMHEKGWLDASW